MTVTTSPNYIPAYPTETQVWVKPWIAGEPPFAPQMAEIPAYKCPHGCGRDRHPEPLTRDVATMYDNHEFREDYNPDLDDSPIVCIGANYHGPIRPPAMRTLETNGWYTLGYISEGPTTNWLTQMTELTHKFITDTSAWILPELPEFKWGDWMDPKPEPLEPCETPEGVTVTFGNDWQPWNHAMPGEIKANIKLAEHIRTHRNDFPIPKSPGYDFSKYAEEQTTPYWIGALK